MNDRMMRLPEVLRLTGLSESGVRYLENVGIFPRRRKIGIRAVGWLESEINTWISNRNTGDKKCEA